MKRLSELWLKNEMSRIWYMALVSAIIVSILSLWWTVGFMTKTFPDFTWSQVALVLGGLGLVGLKTSTKAESNTDAKTKDNTTGSPAVK
jgi:hypothetical protein